MNVYKRNEIACVCGWVATVLGALIAVWYAAGRRVPLWTLALVVLCSCAPPREPLTPAQLATAASAIACEDVISLEILSKAECPAAQLAINADPACHAAYPRGLNLDCPEHR